MIKLLYLIEKEVGQRDRETERETERQRETERETERQRDAGGPAEGPTPKRGPFLDQKHAPQTMSPHSWGTF